MTVSRVATASNDNTVQVWNAVTGEPLTPPLGWEPGNPHDVSFSPDGRLIATGWGSGFARIWDAFTGEPLTGRLRHGYKHVDRVEFSPNGQFVLTASQDGTARLWDLHPDDRPIEDLVLLSQVLCGHRIDATGASLVPVDPLALRDAWQDLRRKYPDEFVATPKDLFTWHREQADACERLGRRSDAIKHFEQAVRYSSDVPNVSHYRDTLDKLIRLRVKAE